MNRALIAAMAATMMSGVSARDDEGRSVLDVAKVVDNGPATQEVIDALVRAGAR